MMRLFFIILMTLFAVGCTKVEVSSGGNNTEVCVGQDTLDCSNTSNDGDDDNTNTSNDGDDDNTSNDGDEDNDSSTN